MTWYGLDHRYIISLALGAHRESRPRSRRSRSAPVRIETGHRTNYSTNNGLCLADGTLVCPYAWEAAAEAEPIEHRAQETMIGVAGVLISTDAGETWQVSEDIRLEYGQDEKAFSKAIFGIDEPAIVEMSNGDIFMLARTGLANLHQLTSSDQG